MTVKIETRTRAHNKQRLFAFCGIVAPILFTLVVVGASLLRPGYSQTHNFISDLGVGPYAMIQNANFVVFGLLSIGFALGLRGGLPAPHGRALKAGIGLVILFGVAMMFAGIFPEDYLSGGPHTQASSIAFLSIIAAQLLIWQGLRSEDTAVWGSYRTYSLISGLLSLILVWFSSSTDYPGAAQRIFLAVPWLWIEVTGLKLFFLTERTQPIRV
ncbi:MAG: DUF998 domain-containing protein [Euryarchaeota archaeon]|nr:DUF998 domain-containing protein [Euryarchaeota archaeon]